MKLPIIPTVTLSGAGTTNGAWTKIGDRKRIGYQVIWTGTLAGTITWQVSNDFDVSQPSLATPTQLTVPASFSAGNPVSGGGSFFFDFQVAPAAEAIRPVFTYSSGSGNLTMIASAKGGEPG